MGKSNQTDVRLPRAGHPRRVLILGDDPKPRARTVRLVREAWPEAFAIETLSRDEVPSGFESLEAKDLLLAEFSSGDGRLPAWFRGCVERPAPPVIVLLIDDEDEDLAAEAIEAGAADVLVEHETRPKDLARSVSRALRQRELVAGGAKMAEQVRRADTELDRVVRSLTHDMSANLMVLEDSVRQLKASHEKDSLAETTEGFAHVDACLRESNRFVNELVTAAKRGELPMEPQRVDLERVAREVVFEQRALIEKRRAVVTIDPRLPSVWCHPSRAKEVLVNLVRNALLHGGSDESPQLAMVRAEPPAGIEQGGYVWIRVYDNGAGIPEAERETIFEPGRRGVGRGAGGSGLGLSIVKNTIEHYGGRLCFDPLCRGRLRAGVFVARGAACRSTAYASRPGREPPAGDR